MRGSCLPKHTTFCHLFIKILAVLGPRDTIPIWLDAHLGFSDYQVVVSSDLSPWDTEGSE